MRWFLLLFIAVVTVTLQTTVAHRLALFGVQPDWTLVIVVFYALHGPYPQAVVGPTVVGLLAGSMTLEPMGPVVAAYAGAGVAAYLIREYLFIRHAKAQFIVTLIIAAMVQIGWVGYSLVDDSVRWERLSELSSIDWAGQVGDSANPRSHLFSWVVGQAFYTALFAPPIHALLLMASGRLGLRKPRYGHRNLKV